jgi:transposase-like protein
VGNGHPTRGVPTSFQPENRRQEAAEFPGNGKSATQRSDRCGEHLAEFVPFLRFDRKIRTVICTANAIESISARVRRAVT